MQLADGLRLMKWIMRGVGTDFYAKKKKKTDRERDVAH